MPEFASVSDLLASFVLPALIAISVCVVTFIVAGWVNELHVWIARERGVAGFAIGAVVAFLISLPLVLPLALVHLVLWLLGRVPAVRAWQERRFEQWVNS